jgi:hypothetical protein
MPDQLIKELKQIKAMHSTHSQLDVVATLDKAIARLRAVDYLLKSAKEANSFLKSEFSDGQFDADGWLSNTAADLSVSIKLYEKAVNGTLNIYHEPPAEGTREWAMEQDGRVTHERWPGEVWVYFSRQASWTGIGNHLDGWDQTNPEYDTGWSLYVPTREPVEGELRKVGKREQRMQQYINGTWRDIPTIPKIQEGPQ